MEQEERKFTLSARPLNKSNLLGSLEPWCRLIRNYFGPGRIDYLYTSVQERCRLYGGRRNDLNQSISYEQVDLLNTVGIGFMLTLSNHYFSQDAYTETIPILERIDNGRNSVVVTNDQLARRIKQDFPLITVKASVIRLVTEIEGIQRGEGPKIHHLIREEVSKTLDLFDYVTLPPKLNKDGELLQSFDCKDRVVLFANGWCLSRCVGPTCYKEISDHIFNDRSFEGDTCRYPTGHEIKNIYTMYDLRNERFQGYSSFKLVPMPLNKIALEKGAKS